MRAAFSILMFTLDRLRTALLALAIIMILKTLWIVFTGPHDAQAGESRSSATLKLDRS